MKNGKGSADRLTLAAPAGGVVSGRLIIIGSMAVMAEGSADEGELFSAVARHECRYEKPTGAGTAVSVGDTAYFDAGSDTLTAEAGAGLFPVGYFTEDSTDDSAECVFVLTGERTAAVDGAAAAAPA